MSVRIIAPPSRVLPIYDDGAFRQSTATIVDDDSWRPFFWPQVAPSITLFLGDDEVALAIQLQEDHGSQVSWIGRIQIAAQPQNADDDLPFTPQSLFDDAQIINCLLVTPRIAQPAYDDEVGGSLKNFALNEDAFAAFLGAATRAVSQPTTDDDWIQFVAPIFDDDVLVAFCIRPASACEQPPREDEVLGTFANFALEIDPCSFFWISPPLTRWKQWADDDIGTASLVFFRGEVIPIPDYDLRIEIVIDDRRITLN
jgi:hypothetical protein